MKPKPIPALTIKTSKIRWENPEAVGHPLSELKALGYRELAPVQTKLLGFVKMLAFANLKLRTYAILHDEAQSIWVDFFSVQKTAPNDCFVATNANAPLIGCVAQRPTFFISYQLPIVSVTLLHTEFLARRPKRAWIKPTLKDLPAAYRQICEADSQWQQQHLAGKDSEEKMGEIVASAYARSNEAQRRIPTEELVLVLRELKVEEKPKLPTTLTAAAMDGDLEAMKLFLDGGSDINEKTGYPSPLAAAALKGKLEAVSFLLEHKANPGAGQFAMFSAIVNAAEHGYYEIVERLLAAGVPRDQHKAALSAAKKSKHKSIISLLQGTPVPLELRAKPANNSKSPSFKESMDELTSLMGREPDSKPLYGVERQTAGKRALELFQTKEVRAAINTIHKPHGDIYGRYGSYLDLAVQTEQTALVNAALNAGSSQKVISTAMITATDRGSRELVSLLLKAGADPKHADEPGWTALLAAARNGDLELVRNLLAAGADPRPRTDGGETPMTAARGPYKNQIRELLKQAASPKLQGRGSAITTRGKPKNGLAEARGVAEFKKAMGHPEWSVAFIAEKAVAVAQAYSKLYPKALWHPDAAQTRLTAKPPCILTFQLRDHDWTILLRTVGWLGTEDITELPKDALALSKSLKTRVITYMSEDTSGCEAYEMFEQGKSIESAERMDDIKFKSVWRKKPRFGDNFPEPVFTEIGIYLPECWMDHDGFETKLALGRIAADAVKRLDCFELKPGK